MKYFLAKTEPSEYSIDDTKLVRQGRLSTMEIPDELVEWLRTKGVEV